MKQIFTKKRLVGLVSAFVLGTGVANAQVTVILNEDFTGGSGTTPPAGWTNNTITGGASDVWRYDNPCSQTLSGAMSGKIAIFDSDCYSGGGGAEDVALESPSLNTTGATVEILEYDVTFRSGFGGGLTVEVHDGSSWVAVKTYTTSVTGVHESIDVSTQMANKAATKVRFRWTGNFSWWAFVDNVKVTQTIPQPNDIKIVSVETFADLCGRSDDTLAIKLENVGTANLTNISLNVNVTGPNSANHSINIPGPLNTGSDTVIKFNSSVFNTLTGGTYNLTANADVTNDADTTNDTISQSFVLDGTPDEPVAMDVERCGNGVVMLTATKGATRDNLVWYDGGLKQVAMGVDTFYTPELTSNNTYTYYVEATNLIIFEDFAGTTGSTPPAGWGQQTLQGDPNIDTWRFNNPGNRNPGGAISNPFAVFDSDNYSIGGGNEDVVLETPPLNGVGVNNISLEFDHQFQAGFGSQIRVEVWNGISWIQVYSTTGQVASSKRTIDISAQASGVSGFKVRFRYLGNWAWWWIVDNVKILGGAKQCTSNQDQITVTVKGLPTGASASAGTPFEGTFKAGNAASPDIVTAGDELNYDFSPPTGFNNADHGTTWQVVAFNFQTEGGVDVPLADYTLTPPSASGNGALQFTPSAGLIDTNLIAQLIIRDLTPGNGCDSVITRRIFVAPVPVADFSNIDVCFGDGMAFDNISTISSGSMEYEWDFGDGNTTQATNPIHKYAAFGTYDVRLITISNYGYRDTQTRTVEVFETPNVSFKHQNACEGAALTFTNTTTVSSGSLSYTWDFGDGTSTSNAVNETHLYSAPGEYTVILTADANNCKASVAKSVFQFPQPTADFSNTGGDCNKTEISFTSNSTIAFGFKGHFWDFGDMIYSTEENPLHTFQTAGTNDVKLIVTSEFGCRDSITKTIILKESPVASFDNTQVCDIDPVEFTNTTTVPAGVNVDYQWNFGDGTTSILTNPTHDYGLPIKRTVTLTATGDNGCVSIATKEVQVGTQPQAEFEFDPVCEDEISLFVNKTTISRSIPVTYEWFVNGTSVSNDVSLNYVFDNDGISKVKLVATASDEGACQDEIEKDIQVDPTPDCNFTVQSANQGNRTTDFTVDNPEAGVDYEWQFGDGGGDNGESVQYKYSWDNVYIVILTATAPNGCSCSDTADFFATTLSTPGVNNIDVDVYPNPNTGNFTVKVGNTTADEVSISVYNTLGEVVYTLPAKTEATANGEYNIKLENMAAGVYTVKVQSGDAVYTTKLNIIK